MKSPVPGRTCGTCTLCCKLLRIPELDKPQGTWCPHCAPARGCNRYDTRPPSCRAFHCGYLVSEFVSEDWLPSKCRIVLVEEPTGITAVVDRDRPDAWKAEPYYSQLKTWATQGITAQRQVVVRIGSRTIAVLPDRDVDLGQMQPGERVAIEGRVTPLGMVYDAYRAK